MKKRSMMLTDKQTNNLIDAMRSIGVSLKYLGNGHNASQMGAIELHAVILKESAETIAAALRDSAIDSDTLQSVIAKHTEAIVEAGGDIHDGLVEVANALREIAAAMSGKKPAG